MKIKSTVIEVPSFEEGKEKDEDSNSGQDEHRGHRGHGGTQRNNLGRNSTRQRQKQQERRLPLLIHREGRQALISIFSHTNFFSVALGVHCVLCVSLFLRLF
jgi:hypothetical protein